MAYCNFGFVGKKVNKNEVKSGGNGKWVLITDRAKELVLHNPGAIHEEKNS
jgi:hypothetical protein